MVVFQLLEIGHMRELQTTRPQVPRELDLEVEQVRRVVQV
jgi:hypothetical protein